MGFIDILFAVLLGFAAFKGLRNGLFVELASLISFFVGIYIAVKFSSLLGDSKTAKIMAFIIILILTIIGIRLLAKMLSKIASTLFLGWLNKLGGATFGVVRMVLFLGVILSLFQKVNLNNALISKKTQEKSLFINPVLKTSEFMLPVLTDWFEDLKSSVQ